MKPYHREIISYLQNEYGATNVQHWEGGNHPRLEFKYQDKPFTLTLNRDNTDRGLATNLKKQDIRRILGQPPEKEIRQPRKLENMMPEPLPFNPALQIESLTKPPEIKQKTVTEIGSIAIYMSNNKRMMRFYIPKNILKKSGFIGKFYDIKPKMGKYNWEIYQSFLEQRKVCSFVGQVSTIDQQNFLGLPPKMGRSPANFFLVGSNIQVQLEGRDIKPLDEKHSTKMSQLRAKKVIQVEKEQPVPEKKIDYTIPPTNTIETPKIVSADELTTRLKSTLDILREIERTTPYRLMRNKETGNWLFSAPRIE